jgi:hypothetical protein
MILLALLVGAPERRIWWPRTSFGSVLPVLGNANSPPIIRNGRACDSNVHGWLAIGTNQDSQLRQEGLDGL